MTVVAQDRASRKAAAREEAMREARAQLAPLDERDLVKTGLTTEQVIERTTLGLTNRQPNDSSRSLAAILRANILTLFNAVVGGSFLLLLILGQWKDALFGFAVISNMLIGIIQEYSSKRTLDKLAVLNEPYARVLRNGEIVQIHMYEVVVDDIMELRQGDQIIADGSIIESIGLEVDESLLTGESEPIRKVEDDQVLAGSGVIVGRASARVVRVGPETYASRLTIEARRFSMVNSELRSALARVVRWISWALIPLMAIIINGQMQAYGGWEKAINDGDWLEAAVSSIASVISMIPQGLILITSIAFVVAAVKLARQKVLVQELPAVEGLARVDVVCFDKTGTLTDGDIAFDAVHPLTHQAGEVLSTDAILGFFGNDPDANLTAVSLKESFAVPAGLSSVAEVPFNSERKWSSFSFAGTGAGGEQTWVMGAPELILSTAKQHHIAALEQAAALAETGRRTLALAVAKSAAPVGEMLPTDLHPVALLTFKEKVRPDAKQTLAYFKEQGVEVVVISGDNPATVAAVAREAGVEHAGDGFDARNLPTDIAALAAVLEQHHVFGRVTPDQKRDMVLALKSQGHVVAMTGDGVNDALALKKADLGIAMGSGAAATKAVARLILLDGKFDTLPGVVAEGRRVIANVERVSRLFLTKTTWAMLLALFFGLALMAFPFLPRQLSAMDGYTIGLPAFALALLPNPRRYVPGFLKRSLMYCIPSGLIIGFSVIALNLWFETQTGWNTSDKQTATSVLMSVAGMWVLVGLARPLNKWRLLVVIAAYITFVGAFVIPFVANFFGFSWLTWSQLAVPFAIATVACFLIELVNRIVGRILTPQIAPAYQ